MALGLILWVWVAALHLCDASILDVFWGVGFVLIAAVRLGAGDGSSGRRIVLAAMAGLWGVRLAVDIGRRNHGKPEDFLLPPAPLARTRRPGRSGLADRRGRRGGRTSAGSALLAQLVEHFHGKEGVSGSSPEEGFQHWPGFSARRGLMP